MFVSKKRSTGMGLIAGKRLTAKMIALMETGERIDRQSGRGFLPENGFEPLDHEVFDGGASLGRSDFGALQDIVREINRRFHMAINTWIFPRVKDSEVKSSGGVTLVRLFVTNPADCF
jgi:hypothetical protein